MSKLTQIAAAIVLASSASVYASSGKLVGVVADPHTSLSGATVRVKGSEFSTVTDYRGEFSLSKLSRGRYTLVVSYIGYGDAEVEVEVVDGKVVMLEPIILNSSQTIEEVVSVGQIFRGEMAAANTQKNALSIKSVIAADGIGKLPDRNAAEAVQRIPGVSIERDQGEGRFVAVRGLPAQWSSTSLNGNRLPTAEEETTSRATAFDFFPSELIEFVEVSKAITPDMEGDAIGGNVNFITKKGADEFILKTNVGVGQNELAEGNNYSANVIYGDRLLDDKLGFIINATAWKRDWATDNFEARRRGEEENYGIYRLELRDYTGTRETFGLNGSVEYELDSGSISASALYGTLIDDETHYKHRLRFDKSRIELQHIRDELITEMTGFELRGDHDLGIDKTLNWQIASYENEFRYGNKPNKQDHSYFVMRFDQKVNFSGLTQAGNGKNYAYNIVDGGQDPWDGIRTYLPENFKMDPSQSQLSWVNLYKVFVNEKDRAVVNVDLEWQVDNALAVKFGAKYRDKQRQASFSDEFYSWKASSGDVPTLDSFSLADQPGRTDYLSELPVNYHALFAPVASTEDAMQFWNSNRSNFELIADESALVNNGGALGRNFTVNETHASLYGMGVYQFNQDIEIVAGIRATHTDTDVSGFTYLEESKTLEANNHTKDYWAILPSFHLTYRASEDINYRFALTRTFSRPDFGDLTAGGTFLEQEQQLKTGNPDLNPTFSTNLDLMVEYYFERVGLLSAGVFYKDIQDPIYWSTRKDTYRGIDGISINRPENGNDAKVAGVEVAFNRDLAFISPQLENFGVMSNATFMDSEMTGLSRSDNPAIPGQADELYNFTLYYDNTLFAARLSVNHKGAYIDEHGTGGTASQEDIYYGANTTVDFTTSYQLNEHALVYLELNNLTDEPLEYYQGNEGRPLQVEYYGIRGMVGLNYQF
ncbi:TonB-dependent receptor [Pseudoalteromonas luteoviolacea]|uniref:TonB-dependent receptor n=1 Tax=Pseudoalteromonas luteoviolacea TaxID=43657 RepID=A0A1C0TW94_9GAMM|nr:TonB-dependent receptor [Pseudoalteromonas luteoviolacea]OCQ23598.1 TonB-dependent receptor [Pseudoalteromonas luteoviolacea]